MIAWRLETYDELASTSDTCMARAKQGEPEGLAIFAARQSAGRGSRGRQWSSQAGNLALSLLIRPRVRALEASVYPLLAGVAVAQALEALLPPEKNLLLKWPNDILLDGGKLAGLLIDAAPAAGNIGWLVIGIGVNLAHAPEIPGRKTIALKSLGLNVEPLAAAQAILQTVSYWLDRLGSEGAPVIHESWLAKAHPIGSEIQVRGAQQTVSGAFAGLSPAGELLLRVENRIERFPTGEILLGTRG